MEIVQSILTNNSCYKAGQKIAVQGLMLHSVGCNQPSAEVFVKEWNKPMEKKRCVHAFIDGITGKVYQTLPWEYRGWHCGGAANNTHIGVEMCEPSGIQYTKGASFNCLDRNDAMAVVKRTYDTAVELFAFLCREYRLDPLEEGVIISHKEGHARKIASGHEDPSHLWNGLQSGYTMDGFRHDVEIAMHRGEVKAEVNPLRMDISEEGVRLIMQFEGCRLSAYQCAAGVWTIGYGHTRGVKPGDKLPSQEAARAMLYEDLKEYTGYVNTYIERKVINFPVNQNQFDALTSFCYNRGSGRLRDLVTGRDAADVAEAMLSYILVNEEVNEGLQRRREAERKLFLS
ncbi:MAG: N-acetylmuramoyl-L-alanine amidase [Lachnospiraceae bacterium]|nr:N-acetylmuramoyl-L-alanine amidase [Lachnospiraceae bacterium]